MQFTIFGYKVTVSAEKIIKAPATIKMPDTSTEIQTAPAIAPAPKKAKILKSIEGSPFPPQSYNMFKGCPSSQYAKGFIGCWDIKTAHKIAKYLKKHGFCVKIRGRGKRLGHSAYRRFAEDLPLEYATHGALYIDVTKLTVFKEPAEQ